MKRVLLCLMVMLQGCQTNNSDINSSLSSEISSLDVKPHQFELDNNEISISSTSKGINIFVPKGSLTYLDGTKVTEPISATFKAYIEEVDMLLSSLTTTTSNEEILVSGGMFNIRATVPSGKELKIVSPWRIEVPQSNNTTFEKAQVFKGVYGVDGLRWSSPTSPDLKLVPIPFDILLGLRPFECTIQSLIMPHVALEKHQNSWLATREFYSTRYAIPWSFRFLDSEFNEYIEPCPFENHVLSIFLPHIDKDLYSVDTFIFERAQQELQKALETGRIFDCTSNTFHQIKYTTEDAYVLRLRRYIDDLYLILKANKNIQYTNIDNRFLLEVDSAYLQKLANKHIDSITNKREDYADINFSNQSIAVAVPDFGWYNIDYFLNQSDLISSDLTIKLNHEKMMVFLLFEKTKSIIQLNEQNELCSLKNNKVPDDIVFIIAMGLNDKKDVLYGFDKVATKDAKEIILDIKSCKTEEFKQILTKFIGN